MTTNTAETAARTSQDSHLGQNPQDKSQIARPTNPSLDRRYGRIGISAVAAAVRYQSVAKNPAYAPVVAGTRDCDGDAT